MTYIQKKYLNRAKLVAHILLLAPFVRMVGLNGSLTRGEAKKSSDIDFLVIIKAKRIWTGRAFVTLLTHLTGLRRYGPNIAGRICLNRYQTNDYLTIFPHDSYHAQTFSKLWPLINISKTYEKYVQKNKWMNEMGFRLEKNEENLQRNAILSAFRSIGEFILSGYLGDIIEKKLGEYQKKRIMNNTKTINTPKGRIRISDKELCFHPVKPKS